MGVALSESLGDAKLMGIESSYADFGAEKGIRDFADDDSSLEVAINKRDDDDDDDGLWMVFPFSFFMNGFDDDKWVNAIDEEADFPINNDRRTEFVLAVVATAKVLILDSIIIQ